MNTENLRGVCITGMPIGSVSCITAARIENTSPSEYRLAKKTDGILVLQGAYYWQEGNDSGYEWRDIPTVELEACASVGRVGH